MVIQKKFRQSAPVLVNVDFQDVVRQTGYLSYYATSVNSGAYAVVTDSNIRSELIETSADNFVSTETDLEFSNPLNLKGDMLFNIPIGCRVSGTDSNRFSGAIAVYKYDGTTETQIGSTQTSPLYGYDADAVGGNLGQKTQVAAFKINTNGTIHFSAGNILRVKLSATCTDAGLKVAIGHDPSGRTWSNGYFWGNDHQPVFESGSTKQTWLLPIKIS